MVRGSFLVTALTKRKSRHILSGYAVHRHCFRCHRSVVRRGWGPGSDYDYFRHDHYQSGVVHNDLSSDDHPGHRIHDVVQHGDHDHHDPSRDGGSQLRERRRAPLPRGDDGTSGRGVVLHRHEGRKGVGLRRNRSSRRASPRHLGAGEKQRRARPSVHCPAPRRLHQILCPLLG